MGYLKISLNNDRVQVLGKGTIKDHKISHIRAGIKHREKKREKGTQTLIQKTLLILS